MDPSCPSGRRLGAGRVDGPAASSSGSATDGGGRGGHLGWILWPHRLTVCKQRRGLVRESRRPSDQMGRPLGIRHKRIRGGRLNSATMAAVSVRVPAHVAISLGASACYRSTYGIEPYAGAYWLQPTRCQRPHRRRNDTCFSCHSKTHLDGGITRGHILVDSKFEVLRTVLILLHQLMMRDRIHLRTGCKLSTGPCLQVHHILL